jgi:hypothetical protein
MPFLILLSAAVNSVPYSHKSLHLLLSEDGPIIMYCIFSVLVLLFSSLDQTVQSSLTCLQRRRAAGQFVPKKNFNAE